MSVPNRAALITKTYKVLKKHYQPVAPPSERTLLEHLLYSCCLENSRNESADEAFAKLQESYFDWNEIRVTTISELSETLSSLPNPAAAASRVKRVLQSVFEANYTFDLEDLKKKNIGVATKTLEKCDGVTSFAVGYVTQAALGGHSICVDQGVVDTLFIIGVITDAEAEKGRVPGMERAIQKSKGVEFSSLLHQLGADFTASPHSPRVRAILTEVAPDAKERFPKRGSKKTEQPEKQTVSRKGKTKTSPTKSSDTKSSRAKPTSPKGQPAAKKKSAKSKKTPAKVSKRSAIPSKSNGAKKKSTSKRLAKKKPR